jgi:death-on-curing protein
MITLQEILEYHTLSIKRFGGSDGVRDMGSLESAVARPFQTFDGAELYATTIEKASAIGESLIVNHPFVDGNKRTGALAIYALLNDGGLVFTANEEAFYEFIIKISTGELNYEQILEWLKNNSYSIN